MIRKRRQDFGEGVQAGTGKGIKPSLHGRRWTLKTLGRAWASAMHRDHSHPPSSRRNSKAVVAGMTVVVAARAVARMSEAISGAAGPACRFAHTGYETAAWHQRASPIRFASARTNQS